MNDKTLFKTLALARVHRHFLPASVDLADKRFVLVAVLATMLLASRPAAALDHEIAHVPIALDMDSLFAHAHIPLESSGGPVTLRRDDHGTLVIQAPGRYEAIGFASGNQFLGVARWSQKSNHDIQTLRCRAFDQGLVSAAFFDSAGRPALLETWTLDYSEGRFISPSSSQRTAATEDTAGTIRIRNLPEPIFKVAPELPHGDFKGGVGGTVLINALVGRDGFVEDARVAKSYPMLDEVAVAAVRRWRFKPAYTVDGQPVAVWTSIPMRFELR